MQILQIDDLPGLWRRSLIVRADGSRDTTSWVRWLQGPSDYADLRQPLGRPDFSEAGCLRQLTKAHLDWMARQDGFAGKLLVSDGIFEWRRDIDFQPAGPTPDRGSLIRDGDVMIEKGYHSPYVEHWHSDSKMGTPAYALRLSDGTNGCAGQFVRAGASFMYARGRSAGLPVAANLAACIAGAGSVSEAQDMADCEISFGSISESGWTIRRSTLPFKEGRLLGMRPLRDWTHVETLDAAADGSKTDRSWEVIAIEGNVD
jgi:hypothetical protein